MQKHLKIVRNTILVLIVALALAYIVWGAYPDPRMNMAELGGLTPDEVIARVGPPRIDPRKTPLYKNPDGHLETWNADLAAKGAYGPLTFIYNDSGSFLCRWQGYEYALVFKNNRVARVVVATK